jgi:hypothetical protein
MRATKLSLIKFADPHVCDFGLGIRRNQRGVHDGGIVAFLTSFIHSVLRLARYDWNIIIRSGAWFRTIYLQNSV